MQFLHFSVEQKYPEKSTYIFAVFQFFLLVLFCIFIIESPIRIISKYMLLLTSLLLLLLKLMNIPTYEYLASDM